MQENKVATETTELVTQNNAEQIKMEVLEHLTEKYNREFYCTAYQSPSLLVDYYTFAVTEKTEDSTAYDFKAFYYPDEEQKFEDGYFGKFLCEYVSDRASELLADKNCKAFVRTTSLTFDESLNGGSSFEAAVAKEKAIDVSIYVFGPENNLKISDIASGLAKDGLTGMLFYYCIDSKLTDNLSEENYGEVLSEIFANKINVISEEKCPIE